MLAAAKAEDKPILLSIGYAACHWCHVMAHESFEDPAIADLMNESFVNIRSTARSGLISAIYQYALALLGEQGGWPLTMFLTPEASRSGAAPIFRRARATGDRDFPTCCGRSAMPSDRSRQGRAQRRDAPRGARAHVPAAARRRAFRRR